MFWLVLVPAAVSVVAEVVKELSDDPDVKQVANDVEEVSNAVAKFAFLAASENPMQAPKVPDDL